MTKSTTPHSDSIFSPLNSTITAVTDIYASDRLFSQDSNIKLKRNLFKG